MAKWHLKAFVQKAIGVLPFRFKINYLFQKYGSKQVLLSDEFFETMLNHFAEFADIAQQKDYQFENKSILELGTGWHPIVPICFFLYGAESITTYDLRSLLRIDNVYLLIEKFLAYEKAGKLWNLLPRVKEDRLKVLEGLVQDRIKDCSTLLAQMNIVQQIGAIQKEVASELYDVVCSVNVLEHVNSKSVKEVINTLTRLMKIEGLAYHAIGVYDHFYHFDKSISKFNYLRYSESEWKVIDNAIQPQNRMRISQFKELFLATDAKVITEMYWDAEPAELDKITVHKDFESVEELAVPYGTFVLRKI